MTPDSERPGRSVELLAPAKINLTLSVLTRELSGFHQIESLFQMISLADRLRVGVRDRGPEGAGDGPSVALRVTGAELGPPEENLVHRAATAFMNAAGIDIDEGFGIEIELTKAIPHGAGLGGGSSDAAATLRALDHLLPGRVTSDTLVRLAAGLGSDVPFFLSPEPTAWGWSRGDRLLPLPALPSLPVLVVIPREPISTPEAYRWLAESREGQGETRPDPSLFPTADSTTWEEVATISENDFEPVVLPRMSEGPGLRDALVRSGAMIARLSGSGSAHFGVYSTMERAEDGKRLVDELFPDVRTEIVHTLERISELGAS